MAANAVAGRVERRVLRWQPEQGHLRAGSL